MTDRADRSDASCPWCSAPAPADARTCPRCGAALAQRDSIGDLSIPGVTDVAGALAAYDARPRQLRAASPSQGVAAGVIPAAALGGPLGLAVVGGIAAVAAAEYLGASSGADSQSVDPANVGDPSGAALMAVERLERGEPVGDSHLRAPERETAAAPPVGDPWRDLPEERR